MTRSQRRARTAARQNRAQRFALPAPATATVRVGKEWVETDAVAILLPVTERIDMGENPNRGKRHVARLDILAEASDARTAEQSRAYSPLTVATPVLVKSGKPGKRSTSYTV